MTQKRKRKKQPKEKKRHGKIERSQIRKPPRQKMTNVVVFALVGVATVAFVLFGVFYGAHKVISIWIMFSSIMLYVLAGCLYWQQQIAGNEDSIPSFSVGVPFAINGVTRDASPIYVPFGRDKISPIPFLLFVRIVNNQNFPVVVSELLFEVQTSPDRWWSPASWMKATQVLDIYPVLWRNKSLSFSNMAFTEPKLSSLLGERPMQSHETVGGWVLLDVPKELSQDIPLAFRVTVRDTAGHKAMVIPTVGTGQLGTSGHEIVFKGATDTTGMQYQHYADSQNPN